MTISSCNINKLNNKLDNLIEILNGGPGSGNFDHAGRPGKVGGSSKDGSGGKAEFSELLSKDAKEALGEVNEYSEGAYFKEINSVLDDFSKLGMDVEKVKFETNASKLPEKMRKQVTDSTNGMISAKKNLEAVIYLDETKQSEYGLGGENKFIEGKEPKDQPWATNNSPIGVLRHELGHLAAYTLFMKSRGRKGTAGPILGGAVNLETHANFKKIFGEGYSLNKLKLSRYGMKDSSEAVAEAFANPNFSSDTKKIYDFYVNGLKKKVENNAVEDDEWLVLCLGFTTEDPLSKKVNQLIRKIDKVINGGSGSGNFGHLGRPGKVGGSAGAELIQDIKPIQKHIKIKVDGKEYSPKQLKEELNKAKDEDILNQIEQNLSNPKKLEANVMESNGWIANPDGSYSLGHKISKLKFQKGSNDVEVMNNGKDYLEGNDDNFYRSEEKGVDGAALYTTDTKETALTYSDNREDKISHLIVDTTNFVNDRDINKYRKKLIEGTKNPEIKKILSVNLEKADIKNTTIAGMLGYDGIIRKTRDSGTEYIVLNIDKVALNRILKNSLNALLEKLKNLNEF